MSTPHKRWIFKRKPILVLILFSLFSSYGWAFPEEEFHKIPRDQQTLGSSLNSDLAVERGRDTKSQNLMGGGLLTLNSSYDFEGIVRLSNCSGSLVIFSGQPKTTQAYVLTNGHCLGFPMVRPGEVKIHVPSQRIMEVADKDESYHRIKAEEIIYGTMTGTDVGLYRLQQTYEEIEAWGIRPFLISSEHPQLGVSINIVSGYWERGYSCQIDSFVYELREAGYVFSDAIRYSKPGCQVIGGTSGSPIIQDKTREVIGINNTGNEDGETCTLNNPCEVDKDGNINVIYKASYGEQTYLFYDCLTPDFQIDTSLASCTLHK